MSAITAKASRKMKKYAILTREPRCFLGSFDFSWEQRKLGELALFNPKDELPQTFEYVDLESVVGTEMLSHRTEAKLSAPSRAQRLAHTGDLFYQTVRPYQKNNYLFEKPDNNYVFSTGYAQMRPYVDGYFLLSLVQSDRFVKVVLDNCTGTSYPAINANDLAKIEVTAPSDENEAQKIGTIFRNIDNLITLHQRKYAFLFRRFRAAISKKLATSTFSWEQRKLGDIGKARSGVGFPDADQGGLTGVPFFKVSDMNSDGNENEMTVANNYVTAEQIADHRWSPITELPAIFFAKVGAAVMLNRKRLCRFPFLLDNNTMAYSLSPTKWDADFAKALFGTVDLTSLVQVGALPSYNAGDVESMEIYLPSLLEQEQIGAYFKHLDNLITLHQRERISFSGRASRLIPPINKKRITSSWEQRKFEEIAVRSSVIRSDDTLPRVEYEDIVSGTGRLNKDIYAKQSIKSGIAFHQGDVLYGKLRPYLQNWLLPTFDGLAVGDFWVLQPQNADSSFLYRLIQSRQFDEVANQSTGTKMPRADWKLVSKTVFSIPSNISEQAAIGTYFTALDSLITLHQRKPFLMKWRTSDANRNQTNRLVL